MPKEQEDFQRQVMLILEAAMFENWLRFYFIREAAEDGQEKLELQLPDKSMERIRELYPALYPMAEKLNGRAVDFAVSRDAVLKHIMEHIDGQEMERGQAQRILQSQAFQIRLQLFHAWAQMHEDQLDQGFLEFGAWRNLFAQWLETPGARELAHRMAESPQK